MTESGRFGFEFGTFGFGDDVDSEGYDDYETRATTVSSGQESGMEGSSGNEAVDLHAEDIGRIRQDMGRMGWIGRAPPMSAFGQSGWAEQQDAELGHM